MVRAFKSNAIQCTLYRPTIAEVAAAGLAADQICEPNMAALDEWSWIQHIYIGLITSGTLDPPLSSRPSSSTPAHTTTDRRI